MRFTLALLMALASVCLHADPTAVSGNLTATGQTLFLGVSNNNSWGVQVSGTWAASMVVEGTVNSVTWSRLDGFSIPGQAIASTITANGIYTGTMPGMSKIRLRVSALTSGTIAATLSCASAGDGLPLYVMQNQALTVTGNITTAPSGAAQAVSVLTSTLPTGASTSNLQTTGINILAQISGNASTIAMNSAFPAGGLPVYLSGTSLTLNTGAVSVSSSALPAGGSTSANQATANTYLSRIDTSTNNINIVGATAANQVTSQNLLATISGSAATTASQGNFPTTGLPVYLSGTSLTLNTGAVSISSSALPVGASTSALQTTGNTSLATIATGIPVSVTRSPSLGGTSGYSLQTLYWNTFTAAASVLPINGTFTTGVNAPFMVTLAPNFGGSQIKCAFHNFTYTPDVLLTSLMGEAIATSATALTYGPFAPGMQCSCKSTASTGVSGTAAFYSVK